MEFVNPDCLIACAVSRNCVCPSRPFTKNRIMVVSSIIIEYCVWYIILRSSLCFSKYVWSGCPGCNLSNGASILSQWGVFSLPSAYKATMFRTINNCACFEQLMGASRLTESGIDLCMMARTAAISFFLGVVRTCGMGLSDLF